MNLNFRAMAALCSVAVSLNTGCESSGSVNMSGGVPPLFSSAGIGGSVIQPYEPTEADFTSAQLADCSIELGEDSVKISGSGAKAVGNSVTINGGGTYRISGSGSQRIVLNSDEDVALILDGVEISSDAGVPIESSGSASLKLTLAENSENIIVSQSRAAISCVGDITINGSGSLFVSGEDGILSDGAVKLCDGSVELSAENNGISGGEYILCAGTDVDISSGAEGLVASVGYVNVTGGSLDVTAGGIGIDAAEAVFISGGDMQLRCGGGSSAVMLIESGEKYPYGRHGGFYTDSAEEYDFSNLVSGDGTAPISKMGIKSGGSVSISGGGVTIDSADDSISASDNVNLEGGSIVISSGDDAIRSEGSIIIVNGTLEVIKSYTALEALAVDIGGGEVKLTSCRDGIKAVGGNDMSFYSSDNVGGEHYVRISGGSVVIDAGGDGIDTGGTAAISGGEVTIFSSDDDSFGSLCYDDSFAISGGTLAAFGSDGLSKAPSMVAGSCLSMMAELTAGSEVTVADEDGAVLFSVKLPKGCSTVVFSSERLQKGKTYHLYSNDELIESVTAVQGISGDGPSGRGLAFDDIHNSDSMANGVVA